MSAHRLVSFEPLDVVFSRDHRPFSMGDHSRATSVLPGTTLLVGALRAALFQSSPRPPEKIRGTADRGGSEMSIAGPFLTRRGEDGRWRLWCAQPGDLVAGPSTGGEPRCAPERALPEHVGAWPCPPSRGVFWKLDEGKDDSGPRLIDAGALEWWAGALDVPLDTRWTLSRDAIVERESRLGLARNDGHVAEEGLLYNLDVFRFRAGWRLALSVDALSNEAERAVEALSGTTVQLGGDGHRATIEVHQQPSPFELKARPLEVGARARLFLLAPLPIERGRGSLAAVVEARGLRLRTLAAGRAEALGGWDMERGRPRPLDAALPAGTVISVDVLNARPSGLIELLPRLEADGTRLDQHLGFGRALLAPPGKDR
jgi:CRISPR-associated protein Cmr3